MHSFEDIGPKFIFSIKVGTPVIRVGSQERRGGGGGGGEGGWGGGGGVPGMRAGREEESKTKLKYASGSQI